MLIRRETASMPKKTKPILSKSEAIRRHKTEHPTDGPKVMADILNQQGYDVTAQFISTVLSNERRKKGLTGRGRRSNELLAEDLIDVKRLVDKLGGIDKAMAAIEIYSELYHRE